MTIAYEPWLPAAAIARAVDELPVRRVVGDWAAAWFVGVAPTVRPASGPVETLASGTPWVSEGVALVVGADAEAVLAELIFGAVPADATAGDRTTIASVVAACLADLRARLAKVVGAAAWRTGEVAPARRWQWRVDAARAAVLHVAVEEAAIVRRVRAALPEVDGVPLVALADAMASQRVDVAALVGRSRVTTVELTQLAGGDVVVLDRALDAPAPLAIDGVAGPLRCAIVEHDDHLTLTLVDRETP
ncbi:FliM/FliN family flagellar motor C-terminal domain-containing protein [Sphingomonas phyllosphaerae]|uniref:FliM/FliN family flagellar motor C-terminal domain-containing protein n=1 Tax=Sphingomonas phyllosphaerae TaxID=257003 RepID=UPI0004240800|nr:FliM/FliN family flagellar motor C-terminal domain-containing protein [Sphingomonas phyllosphaerae]